MRRVEAVSFTAGVVALEEPGLSAVVLSAVALLLVLVVTAVILPVTAPPERHALVRVITQHLRTNHTHTACCTTPAN